MPQVIQPQGQSRKAQQFQLLGTVIGAGVGAATANPGAGLAGASAGASMGGSLGSVGAQTSQASGAAVPSPGTGALARRQQQLETDNLTTLRNAEMAAARLPEQQRQRILPTLTQARMLEQRQRGVT